MIYFVDEDYRQLRALVSELQFRGLEAEVLPDADTAYSLLAGIERNSVELVFIDVMLAACAEESRSRYTRLQTDDFHKTGIFLLNDLTTANPLVFPKRSVFLTHASNGLLVSAVEDAARLHGVEVWRKRDFLTAHDFGERVEKHLATLRGGTK